MKTISYVFSVTKKTQFFDEKFTIKYKITKWQPYS